MLLKHLLPVILGPVIRSWKDIGEVKILQGLVVSEGGSLFPLFSHTGLHKFKEFNPFHFYWNPAKSFVDKPVDVGLEQNLWQFLWSDLLMLLEDLAAVRVGFLVLFMCTSCWKWLKAAKAATPAAFLF